MSRLLLCSAAITPWVLFFVAAIVYGQVAFPLAPPRDLRVGRVRMGAARVDPTCFLGLVPTRALKPVCGSELELTWGLTKQRVSLSLLCI